MIFCSLEHKTITNAKKVGAVNRSFLTNKFCFSRVTSEVANNTYYYRREMLGLQVPDFNIISALFNIVHPWLCLESLCI